MLEQTSLILVSKQNRHLLRLGKLPQLQLRLRLYLKSVWITNTGYENLGIVKKWQPSLRSFCPRKSLHKEAIILRVECLPKHDPPHTE